MTEGISLASLDVARHSSLIDLAIAELREIAQTVDGETERFLAASAVVGPAVRQLDVQSLLALKREAKALSLLTMGEFDQIAGAAREQARDEAGGETADGRGPSQATRLVSLATSQYDFSVTPTGEAFAVPKHGSYLARMLHGGRPGLRQELARALYDLEGAAPNGSALSDAFAVLEGMAQQMDPVDLALRTGRFDRGLVLDIGDATGRVIVITADGWEIVGRSPVLFRRTAATMPLPDPVHGGTLDETLFSLLNIRRDDRPLAKAVLVHYLWPDISHVIAKLTGRDGTAKTSATRIMRSLIDPCAAPTKAMPRDEKDWIVAVMAAQIAAVDNVSDIPDWLSDAMCRASTGEGLIRRKLYTDSDVSILSARRIIILNGIDATVKRADFARRLTPFELEPIAEIRSDKEIEAAWARIHPYALGALLDLAVATLKRLPDTRLEGDHRKLTMSDFAQIVKAVDEHALDHYVTKQSLLSGDVIDADQFAVRLIEFIDAEPDGQWSGLAKDLLGAIPKPEPLPRSWPKDPARLGNWVRRFARVLESTGIELTKEDRTKAGQPYTIRRTSFSDAAKKVGKTPTSPTHLHHDSTASRNADSSDVGNGSASTPPTPLPTPAKGPLSCDGVGGVGDVGLFPTLLAGSEEDAWKSLLGSGADGSGSDGDHQEDVPDTPAPVTKREYGGVVREISCPRCSARFETAVDPGEETYCKECGHAWK